MPEASACTLIKSNDRPSFPITVDEIAVIAIEDDIYYNDFPAGEVHQEDIPR